MGTKVNLYQRHCLFTLIISTITIKEEKKFDFMVSSINGNWSSGGTGHYKRAVINGKPRQWELDHYD